jgi:GntR family transcriptional regulator
VVRYMSTTVIFELRKGDPRPVYRQIADEVCRAISVGVLRPGDALPSTRQLAGDLNVNTNTVIHAYKALEGERVIEMRRGRGAFVATAARDGRQTPAVLARQVAERALRDAFRHGILATDLIEALKEIAPRSTR